MLPVSGQRRDQLGIALRIGHGCWSFPQEAFELVALSAKGNAEAVAENGGGGVRPRGPRHGVRAHEVK